eukprot:1586944-Amphidinium_carterae.2
MAWHSVPQFLVEELLHSHVIDAVILCTVLDELPIMACLEAKKPCVAFAFTEKHRQRLQEQVPMAKGQVYMF